MTDDRPATDRWLTYIEASELLGISPEAVRALSRRQKWPRRRANAVGQPVHIIVPPERLRKVAANGQSDIGQWPQPSAASGQSDTTNGQSSTGQWPQLGVAN